eukprot:TRINITY_DN29478_c0_g1_i5.p1 TRINITY_DN29478_c0_g1~~TRINITY_DN29478_c0_g1_i5.p1  ORF type:complete len:337 (-),score=75.79 TRINITY_DN29478_c0_g1_i5:199-1209(-)
MSDIDVISLNVGGVRMQTFRSTLTKYPRSFLKIKFNSDTAHLNPMTDDGYFLDRDPDTFRLVLNYLRRGVVSPNLTTDQLVELRLEAEHFNLQDLRIKVDAALTGGDKFVNFNVAGDIQKVNKDLFGKTPKSAIIDILELVIAKDFYSGDDETMFFHNAEAFSMITNSLRHGFDVTMDMIDGGSFDKHVSYATRLLLFSKNSIYSQQSSVKVQLSSPNSTLEKDVPRELLLKDPNSDVAKALTDYPTVPDYEDLNNDGNYILQSKTHSIKKIEAVLAQMEHSGLVKVEERDEVDEMSEVAREVGLLSSTNLLSATQFKRDFVLKLETALAAKRLRY